MAYISSNQFILMSNQHSLRSSLQSQVLPSPKITNSSTEKLLMNKSKRAESLVISCSKCSIILVKYRKLKDLLVQVQNQKEELVDDIDLLFSNFSYILELVSENINEKVKEYIQEHQEASLKKLIEARSQKQSWCWKLITSQKRQISLLKRKLLTLENENESFRTKIYGQIKNSNCSFKQNIKSKQEKSVLLQKQNQLRESIQIASSAQIQEKIDGIEELRKKLRLLKTQISKSRDEGSPHPFNDH